MDILNFKDDYFIYSNRGNLSKAFYDDLLLSVISHLSVFI